LWEKISLRRHIFSESYIHWGSVEMGKQNKVSNVHIEYAGDYEKLPLFSNPYLKASE
jgi:hypothetical protein